MADMAFFEEQVKIVLPMLGFDLFRPANVSSRVMQAWDDIVFEYHPAGASAQARETADGFLVLASSTARRDLTPSFPEGYRILRDQLVSEGKLASAPAEGLLFFTSDVVFSSPSAAAAIVSGRSANGPMSWCLIGTGKTYRTWKTEVDA